MLSLIKIDRRQALEDSYSRNMSLPWLRMKSPMISEDQLVFYDSLRNDPTRSFYHIYSDTDACIVGICGLTDITTEAENPSAEFSLLIYPMYREFGYGEEALRKLLDLGFETLDTIYGETFLYPADSTYGMIFTHNEEVFSINPAWKIFNRIGFNIDGVLRKRNVKYGRCIDSLVFSMSRERWKELKK